MDDDLRALERRWQESQSEEDLERFLHAWSRALGAPVEWLRLKHDLRACDLAQVEERARTVLAEAYREDPNPSRRYDRPLYLRYHAAVVEAAGPWFPGLSEEWEPPWCPCHWLPSERRTVDECVERTLAQVRAVYAYKQALLALGETGPEPGEERGDYARRLGQRVIDLVMEVTGCNDAWYREVLPAFRFVSTVRLGSREGLEEELGDLIEARFTSWVGPTPEVREEVCETFARHLFAAEEEGP